MHNYTPITGRKIRLALVGCGRIANNHFGAIESHVDSVELVDVCDVNCLSPGPSR
jgi:UDP-N-acetyl-2-amino-2-deoxyglucuronate dehydrogenase